jgi:hypothetical protein
MGRALRILGKIAYWFFLIVVLLILPVFQSWDFLPETPHSRILKLSILGGVILTAVLTRSRKLLHFVCIGTLLVAGVVLFCLNQGIIRQPVTGKDVQILMTTKELLSNESQWDRSPSRECLDQSKTFTLYCAVREASIRDTGGFRHRAPALQVLRSCIEKQKPNADYPHRLSGFNNDPAVSFADLHRLLDAAIVQARAEEKR